MIIAGRAIAGRLRSEAPVGYGVLCCKSTTRGCALEVSSYATLYNEKYIDHSWNRT